MSTTSPPAAPPDRETLAGWGAEFQNALLDSADAAKLGAGYWDRARAALEAASDMDYFGGAVAVAARKLEIAGALPEGPAAVIGKLARLLSDEDTFADWADLCGHDAVYVTALARIWRDEHRGRAGKAAKKAARGQEETETEPGF